MFDEARTQIAAARDLQTLAAIVRRRARALLAADGVTFVLREGDSCHYYDEDAIAPLWKGRRFPLRMCVSGWVLEHATAVAIPDVYADPRVPVEAYRPTFVKSLAMVPLGTRPPLAVVGAYWATPHKASAAELRSLQVLADHAADALRETCRHCGVRGFVRVEHVIARATSSLQSYCGACEGTWSTGD
jgi:GAF domain-containing protein